MIKTFGKGRSGIGLTWDERYPTSYVYKPSKAIANLMRKLLEIRTREAMNALFMTKDATELRACTDEEEGR